MRQNYQFLLLALFLSLAFAGLESTRSLQSTVDYSTQGADWTGTCASGIEQSPIDVSSSQGNCENTIVFNLRFVNSSVSTNLTDNGYAYEMSGTFSTLYATTVDSVLLGYTGTSMQIHAPSEHTIQGIQYDMELQIYHQITDQFASDPRDGRTIAAVSILFKVDDTQPENPLIESFKLSGASNETDPLSISLGSSLGSHLTTPIVYYAYKGSKTTPPCDQTVNWYVLDQVLTMTSAQLEPLTEKWSNSTNTSGIGNYRKTQSVGTRIIQKGGGGCQSQYVYFFSFFLLFSFIGYFVFRLL